MNDVGHHRPGTFDNLVETRFGALDNHPVYDAVRGLKDLRCFMEHHVYSVWDFMSLIKHLQRHVAPATVPWAPSGDASARRFINELVLEEESDQAWPGGEPGGFASHFELYLEAMREIGADPSRCLAFVERVASHGIDRALSEADMPAASRRFTKRTFEFINANGPHVAAAALAFGREHIIPVLFRAILGRFGVGENDAPVFHYYLKRHVHLDEDFHAPLSLRLVEALCEGDAGREAEAKAAAHAAIDARLDFWNGVHDAIAAGARDRPGWRNTGRGR